MKFFPQDAGSRPRLACEISPEGVVAARSEAVAGLLTGAAQVPLSPGAVVPSLRPGNIPDRVEVITAMRRVLERIGARGNGRGADLSLIIPDAATRVLLLDFDTLPSKLADALPLVRFRLKKLLPFEAEDAMVSYQPMTVARNLVRVLAVAIPREVLAEYETVAREAGFEPGAVLPSTLACLPAVESEEPVLLVNTNRLGLTTAILRGGTLLLHRSVELDAALPASSSAESRAASPALSSFSLADRETTAAEWAAQQPLPEYGERWAPEQLPLDAGLADLHANGTSPAHSIFLSDGSLADLAAAEADLSGLAALAMGVEPPARSGAVLPAGENTASEEEIAQALNVAVAYFEDTLSAPPTQLLCAGGLSASALGALLARQGLPDVDGLPVRELVANGMLAADAVSAAVSRGTLAGVVGALRG